MSQESERDAMNEKEVEATRDVKETEEEDNNGIRSWRCCQCEPGVRTVIRNTWMDWKKIF